MASFDKLVQAQKKTTTEMAGELKHMNYNLKQRELGLFSLWIKRLLENLAAISYYI